MWFHLGQQVKDGVGTGFQVLQLFHVPPHPWSSFNMEVPDCLGLKTLSKGGNAICMHMSLCTNWGDWSLPESQWRTPPGVCYPKIRTPAIYPAMRAYTSLAGVRLCIRTGGATFLVLSRVSLPISFPQVYSSSAITGNGTRLKISILKAFILALALSKGTYVSFSLSIYVIKGFGIRYFNTFTLFTNWRPTLGLLLRFGINWLYLMGNPPHVSSFLQNIGDRVIW